MSMINKEIDDFTVQAFHNDDFETVTKDDVLGKWGVILPRDSQDLTLPLHRLFSLL